jgi:predicted TPR repeat methyltransferase
MLIRAADGLHFANEREAALDAAEFAMARFPDAADPALVYAIFATNAGRHDDARRAAQQVLRIDPNNRQVRSVLQRLAPAPR